MPLFDIFKRLTNAGAIYNPEKDYRQGYTRDREILKIIYFQGEFAKVCDSLGIKNIES